MRGEVGGGLFTAWVHPKDGATDLMYGPALAVDIIAAMPEADARWYPFFGVTWGMVASPVVEGRSVDGALSWAGPGGGGRWTLSDAWSIEGALYVVRATARFDGQPSRDTGLAGMLRARVAHRWRLGGAALDAGASVAWFRASDDENGAAVTTDHAVWALSVAWAIGGDAR